MKVIELFIKLSEGREIPYKIKYEGYIFEYNINHKRYESYFSEQIWTLRDFININDDLNNEIEIIEEEPQEHKIPEKLEDISEIKCVGCKVEINIAGNKTLFDTDTPIVTEHCIYKINQLIKNQNKLIDYLKSKGE